MNWRDFFLNLNLRTERNASLWIPMTDRRLNYPKIWDFFEANQPNFYMWTGIERFDENRFWINGQPTYAPSFFNHTDKVWMNFGIPLTWINMNCRIHLNSETNHATQYFYSSVMLHATVEPEDQCPVQRLDYDRTNLLKNHPPEAEFVNRKHFAKCHCGL